MRIGVVGGVERNEVDLTRLASAAGHEVEMHSGHIGGRGTGAIERLVARCDLVMILVEVNSHGAVLIAKRTANRLGRPVVVMRNCGPARFEKWLEEIAAHATLRSTHAA